MKLFVKEQVKDLERSNKDKIWILYILRCADGSLYTGVTKDLERRFQEHESQGSKCAKYLRGKGPFEVVYQESGFSRSSALRRELEIKSLSKEEKEMFISAN